MDEVSEFIKSHGNEVERSPRRGYDLKLAERNASTSREAAVHAGCREFQRVATLSGRSQSRYFSTGLVKPLLGKVSLQMTYHRLGVRPGHCFLRESGPIFRRTAFHLVLRRLICVLAFKPKVCYARSVARLNDLFVVAVLECDKTNWWPTDLRRRRDVTWMTSTRSELGTSSQFL